MTTIGGAANPGDGRPWEQGSQMHLDPAWLGRQVDRPVPWSEGRLWGTGRQALHALVAFGIPERGWTRLWYPSYFCLDALRPLLGLPVDLQPYRDSPVGRPEPPAAEDLRDGDVVLTVNTLGLRATQPATLAGLTARSIPVIEDHTHDPHGPWASASTADYAIASLRKTLPLPDGGAAWSPQALPLPPPPAAASCRPAAERLAGMLLKTAYLAGGLVDKGAFRDVLIAADRELEGSGASPMSEPSIAILRMLDLDGWRAARGSNFAAFVSAFDGGDDPRVLAPEPGATPFCVTLAFEDAGRREDVRQSLIARDVYPAVLWPQDTTLGQPVSAEDADLAKRLLMIHCDLRSSAEDMRRVAAIAGDACRSR